MRHGSGCMLHLRRRIRHLRSSKGCALRRNALLRHFERAHGAYEFSFVAVPAQRDAGVLKGMGTNQRSLKELACAFGAQKEYAALMKEAQLGRKYRQELEENVVKLCLSLELGAEREVLMGIVSKAAAEDLLALREALKGRMEEMYPVHCQLASAKEAPVMESEYLI